MKNNNSKSSSNLIKITAIVSSVVVLLIILVLTYIFWYQDPNKVAKDVVLNTIAAKNFTSDGNTVVTISGKDDNKIIINTKSDTNGKNTQAKMKISSQGKTLPTIQANAQMKMTTDGAFYIKIENLKETINKAVSSYVDKMMKSAQKNDGSISEQQRQQLEDSINKQLGDTQNTFASIDNKWIRFSVKDMLDGEDKKIASCQFEQIDRIKTDSAVRSEIGDIFKENKFVKLENTKELKSKGNSKPYSIKFNKDKFNKFGDEFSKSDFVKDINKKCGESKNNESKIKNASDNTDINSKDITNAKNNTKFNVWIDRFSHKVTSIETKTKYSGWDIDFKTDINYGNAPSDIKMPSDNESVSFNKIVENINKAAVKQSE